LTTEKIRLVPLGGLGKVGKNIMVVEYGNDIIIIDAGVIINIFIWLLLLLAGMGVEINAINERFLAYVLHVWCGFRRFFIP